jgi:hypothetical protein
MMAHAPAMLAAMACTVVAIGLAAAGASALAPAVAAAVILALLAGERTVAGVRAWRRSGDACTLAFPVVHLLRDAVWAWAICSWAWQRWRRVGASPTHTMRRGHPPLSRHPRVDAGSVPGLLAILPAYNEALNLRRVVSELRRAVPTLEVLVVDDGSTDDTVALLPDLAVRWLSLPQRVGVGGAVRTGLRYAAAHGFDTVVRVDGDGQHRACDIARLLAPIVARQLDVAIGSRHLHRPLGRPSARRLLQRTLAGCLTIWTRQRITDPTSGFWCYGPRATRLLRRHHPTGYPEPELLLLLVRNGLRVGEVPIRVRPRRAGQTSLTPARTGLAFARTVLALVLVPVRRAVRID